MQIESICVTSHICGGFEQVSMGRNAETKSLPFLSVVQSTHGSYRIALDDGPALETGEMGVFVAPRARMQHLLHIPDERDGTMSAQWIFLDVEVNRRYRLDDLFLFPTVLPEKYHQDIYVLLRRIAATERLTDRLPDIHRLLCILLEVAMPMKSVPEDVIRLRNYIENHFSHPISTADLANILHCSRAGMFRAFRQSFGNTPGQYITNVRIRHAQLLLQSTDMTVAQIASAVGIPDAAYFSKLFHRLSGCTAGCWREKSRERA